MVARGLAWGERTASVERSTSHDDLDVTLAGFGHCDGGRSESTVRNVWWSWVGRARKTRGKLRRHVLIVIQGYSYKYRIETRENEARGTEEAATIGHSRRAACTGQRLQSDCMEGSTSSLYDMMVLLTLEVSTQVTKSSMCLHE